MGSIFIELQLEHILLSHCNFICLPEEITTQTVSPVSFITPVSHFWNTTNDQIKHVPERWCHKDVTAKLNATVTKGRHMYLLLYFYRNNPPIFKILLS